MHTPFPRVPVCGPLPARRWRTSQPVAGGLPIPPIVTVEKRLAPRNPEFHGCPLRSSAYLFRGTGPALACPYDALVRGVRSTSEAESPSPEDMVARSQPPWALVASVLPAAAALLTRMPAIDLAYHVRAGELALRSGDVVRTDPFTFTHGGLPWLNQQWGAQVMFGWANRILGWAGVALTYAAATGAGFALLYAHCRRRGAIPRTAAVLALLGFIVATGPAPRPQALAVPLFAGTGLLLARRDRWTWLVPVLALVWANVHGSFVLAPLLVAFAIGDDLFAQRSASRSVWLLLLTVAATVVTPFGANVWSYALDIVGNDTIRHSVVEWRPPTPTSVVGAAFWGSGLAVAALAIARRHSVRPMDAARLIVFFALGAPAIRGTLWWCLVAPPVLAGWFAPMSEPEPRPHRHRPDALASVAAACVLALLPLALLLRSGIDPVTGASARLGADAPEVLVDATRRALPAGSRLLVYQPFASWFEFSNPGDPVMVDSRIELYTDRVWRDYDRAIGAEDDWEQILARYRVKGVVLPPGAVLKDDLAGSDGWSMVIDGPAGSIFVRD